LQRIGKKSKDRNGRLVTVLDIGTSKVVCLIAVFPAESDWLIEKGFSPQPRIIGYGYQKSGGVKAGMVTDMLAAEKSIRKAVDAAERMAHIHVDEVIVSVSAGRLASNNFTANIPVNTTAITDAHIRKLLHAAHRYAAPDNRASLHVIPISYNIDGYGGMRDPRAMAGEQLGVDIHAVNTDVRPLQNLRHCIENCHLTPIAMVAAPYASGLASISGSDAEIGVACIDMGAGVTTLSVFYAGNMVFTDAIAIGGGNITNDLGYRLSTSLPQAERIKVMNGNVSPAPSCSREVVSFPADGPGDSTRLNHITKAQLSLFIRPRAEEILSLIRDRLYKSGMVGYAGNNLVITGGGADMAGMSQLAGRIFGNFSVKSGRPRHIDGMQENLRKPSIAAAAGLLLYPMHTHWELGSSYENHFKLAKTGYLSRVGNWLRENF
jgi:cell division protein FtsA